MRSPRSEFRPARDTRYHRIPGGLSTLVPVAPLRRTNNEDDDVQRILAQYTYTMTSAPFFGDLYVSSEAWHAFCGSRASQVRWDPLKNGWDSYVMAPLIGQYSVSIALLTNQPFVWVYRRVSLGLGGQPMPSFLRQNSRKAIFYPARRQR